MIDISFTSLFHVIIYISFQIVGVPVFLANMYYFYSDTREPLAGDVLEFKMVDVKVRCFELYIEYELLFVVVLVEVQFIWYHLQLLFRFRIYIWLYLTFSAPKESRTWL